MTQQFQESSIEIPRLNFQVASHKAGSRPSLHCVTPTFGRTRAQILADVSQADY